MSIETRLKYAVNVRPVTITELDGRKLLIFVFISIVSAAESL